MRDSASWSLLSLAVGFMLAVLGLPDRWEWLQPYLLVAAAACLAASAICFAWPLRNKETRVRCAEFCKHPLRLAKLIEPVHVIILGLLIALSGAIWMWRVTPTIAGLQSTIIAQGIEIERLKLDRLVGAPKPPSAPSEPIARTQPPAPPPIPADEVGRLQLYIQTKTWLADARQALRQLEINAQSRRADLLKPHPLARARGHFLQKWNEATEQLQKINDLAFPGRAINLTSAPEWNNPLHLAPDEEKLEDLDQRYQFRRLHFLFINAIKSAQALVSDLEKELARVERVIADTPTGKTVVTGDGK
jgi:hypothetical protein